MNYYQFHIGDFRSGTVNMSRKARWIYRDMIDAYYDTEQPLPTDLDVLCEMIGVECDEERQIVERHLRFKFAQTDEGYRHAVCDYVIAEYRSKADVARANGKKGGRPKSNPEKPSGFLSGSNEVPISNQDETGSKTNQEPLTTNHKPEDKSPCAQQADHDATFAIFWKLYPQKKARKEALKSWMKIKPTGDLLNQIMNGLAAQRASADWIKDGGQFVPHASTWLNNSRWEDEVRDGGDTRGQSQRGLSLVEQVAECNRQREQQEGTGEPSGAFASLEAIDGEFMAVDDEYVRTQMDFGSWPGRQ